MLLFWSGLIHHQGKSQSGQHKEFVKKRDALTWRQAIGPDASPARHVDALNGSLFLRALGKAANYYYRLPRPPGWKNRGILGVSICRSIPPRLPPSTYGSHKGNLGVRNGRNLFYCRLLLRIKNNTADLNLYTFFFLSPVCSLCQRIQTVEEEGQKYKNLGKHGRGGKSWAGRHATMEPAGPQHPIRISPQ